MNTSDEDRKPQNQFAEVTESEAFFSSYLDTLLSEIDTSPDAEAAAQTKVAITDAAIHGREQRSAREDTAHQANTASSKEYVLNDKHQTDSGLPHWAISPFQVLMFEVADITMGVPLVGLKGILQWSDPVCRLPGQPLWHLGLIGHGSQKIAVVDTRRMIMPERVDSDGIGQSINGGYLLLIGDGDYGLLIDKIKATVELDKGDVKWRRCSAGQAWLAGVIVGQLSVLLNVDALLTILHSHQE